MEHKKLVKFAAVLDKIAQVGTKVFLVVCIVCAVFAVLVMALGGLVMEPNSFVLELGFAKLHLAETYQTVTPLMRAYTAVGLLSACVFLFGVRHGLVLLRRVLAPMKEGKPFAEETALNIGKMSWLVFVCGTVLQVLNVTSQVLLVLALPMGEILGTPAVTELGFSFQIDFGFVLVFVVLRLMAYVFAYGQVLQRQSDETL